MRTDPLGVLDLYPNLPPAPLDTDHWYWCRAEHANGVPHGAEHVSEPTYDVCIRVGPFMTQREANRLGGLDRHNKPGDLAVDCWGSPMTSLGMEIET